MRIAAGSDHAGFVLKSALIAHLGDLGHDVVDLGTHEANVSVDYPDYGAAVARAVAAGQAEYGLCVCGTGIGIGIAANKIAGIRAAVVHDVTSARLGRAHNDANVVCLGERVTGPQVAREALDMFLSTTWEGGRHALRLDKIAALENREGTM
jgi:ribose 5-phosphate isomerase B